jgi:hypothetical protein
MSDDLIYRYYSFKGHNIQSLVDGTIYFSSPDKFNDPFDCSLDISDDYGDDRDGFRQAMTLLESDQATSAINAFENDRQIKEAYFHGLSKTISEDQIAKYGVACFASSNTISLMWSHYADKHKGFCVGFTWPDRDSELMAVSPVNYASNAFVRLSSVYKVHNQQPKDYVMERFFVKDENWRYEEEIRLVSHQYVNQSIVVKGMTPKTICFGLNTPKLEKDTLMCLLKNKHEICFFNMERQYGLFDLKPSPITAP